MRPHAYSSTMQVHEVHELFNLHPASHKQTLMGQQLLPFWLLKRSASRCLGLLDLSGRCCIRSHACCLAHGTAIG